MEGLAEWVALAAAAGRSSSGTSEPAGRRRRRRAAASLPPDDEAFAAGAAELNRAYAEAWLACRYVAERYSAAQLGRLYAELDRGRSLDEASRAVLGVGADELTAGWRRYLVRLAGAG